MVHKKKINKIIIINFWYQVALDNSNVDIDDEVGPVFSPVQSVETLQNHFLEVSNQLQVFLYFISYVFKLCCHPKTSVYLTVN